MKITEYRLQLFGMTLPALYRLEYELIQRKEQYSCEKKERSKILDKLFLVDAEIRRRRAA